MCPLPLVLVIGHAGDGGLHAGQRQLGQLELAHLRGVLGLHVVPEDGLGQQVLQMLLHALHHLLLLGVLLLATAWGWGGTQAALERESCLQGRFLGGLGVTESIRKRERELHAGKVSWCVCKVCVCENANKNSSVKYSNKTGCGVNRTLIMQLKTTSCSKGIDRRLY